MPSSESTGLFTDADGRPRCFWCAATPAYRHYHDTEWGLPVADDRRLFEKLCLEGFQAGLSWLTILNKREAFRSAFASSVDATRTRDAAAVARFGPADVDRLLHDAGIVRHRGKIESTINNAQRLHELQDEFGSLAAYAWRFEPTASSRPKRMTLAALKTLGSSPESTAMSKDLKRRGWSFVGPTTVYAFMQAMGLVNDHIEGCHVRATAHSARSQLLRPEPLPLHRKPARRSPSR
jgi:DNA-3-methyladenine glycosylase I